MAREEMANGALTITVDDSPTELHVTFRGRSTEREPGLFLVPLLSRLFEQSLAGKKCMVLDFHPAEYFNSSSITPVIRLLETARKSSVANVRVLYSKSVQWQSLSFSALRVFHTADGRVTLQGA
ncbi:MAG: hypothetical protein AAB426_09545 [Myxococcota bacterium]